MRKFGMRSIGAAMIALLFLAVAAVHAADPPAKRSASPPIEQNLVREGEYAVKLVTALSVGDTDDEIEAETRLGELGISPRNGWIADYPVTPDIIAEVRQGVADAADAGRIPLKSDEALRKFEETNAGLGLAVRPYTGDKLREKLPEGEKVPETTVINNYYYEQGPPVVTYYAPPPDFYYLYSWVPFPFWWTGFWFPGYFILHDFHRVKVYRDRPVFISNHYNDVRNHRVFRVDPVSRFRGKTYAGIGVPPRKEFISTGVPRSPRKIFNEPRNRMDPGVKNVAPRSSRTLKGAPPPSGGGRAVAPPRGGRNAPPAAGRTISPPAAGRSAVPAPASRPTAAPPGGSPRGGGGGHQERGERR